MTVSEHALRIQLADAMHQEAVRGAGADSKVRGAEWQTATVTAVNGNGTVNVGVIVARCLDSYQSPAVGDQIFLTNNGAGNWVAVGRISSANVGIGGWLFKRKPEDTPRSSTTTATDDPHLAVTVAPNAVYTVECYIAYIANTVGDIRIGFTAPSGSVGAYATRGPELGAGVTTTTAQVRIQSLLDFTTTIPMGGQSTSHSSAHPIGTLVTGANGGSFALRWCQNVSDPGATTIYAHSWMKLQRMA